MKNYILIVALLLLVFCVSIFPQSVTFVTDNMTIDVGGTVVVPIKVAHFIGITGVQFSMRWDPAVLQFNSVGKQGIANENFNLDYVNSGLLTFLAYNTGGATLSEGGVLFAITFKALGGAKSYSSISFSDNPTLRRVAINTTYLTFISNNGQVFISPVLLLIKIFLEGPYDQSTHRMRTDLYPHVIPTKSPYNDSLMTLGTTVPDSIVDWIMIKLLSAPDGTVKTSQSALLSKNGFICNLHGGKGIQMSITNGSYYINIRHRNHMSIQSATSIALGGTLNFYDFTNSFSKYYGTDAKILETGKYGMYAGDVNDSGIIDETDSDEVWKDKNKTGYLGSDADLSGVVNAFDRSLCFNNRNKHTNIPH